MVTSPIPTPVHEPWFAVLDGGITRCDRHWSQPQGYYADYYRCYAPGAGQAVIHLGARSWRLRPGAMYFIPGYRRVGYATARSFTVRWLHFRSHLLELEGLLSQIDTVRPWPAPLARRWQPLLQRLGEIRDGPAPSLAHALQAMLLDLTIALVGPDLDHQAAHPPDPTSGGAALLERLQPAVRYLEENYLQNPPLARIAALTGLSPTYFHAQFTRLFHLSPHHYMLRLRMRQARQLLAEGEWSVREVARQSGYANVFYFSRVFRRYFGLSPRQARGQAAGLP